MHIITTWAELADWLYRETDTDIATLLRLRRDQLIEHGELTDLGTFIIVHPGDKLENIESSLGIAITMDGLPTWEWVERHGAVWEAPIIFTDDGFGHVLVIPDAAGVDPELLALCRQHA